MLVDMIRRTRVLKGLGIVPKDLKAKLSWSSRSSQETPRLTARFLSQRLPSDKVVARLRRLYGEERYDELRQVELGLVFHSPPPPSPVEGLGFPAPPPPPGISDAVEHMATRQPPLAAEHKVGHYFSRSLSSLLGFSFSRCRLKDMQPFIAHVPN